MPQTNKLQSSDTLPCAQHGHSTGVHVHLDSPFELTEAIHAVLTDLQRWSDDKPRKTFLSGSSLGGWTR